MYKYVLPIGDWSSDGHGKYQRYTVETNYDQEALISAYEKTVEKTGLALHRDYPYFKEGPVPLFTEYEEDSIKREYWDILVAN